MHAADFDEPIAHTSLAADIRGAVHLFPRNSKIVLRNSAAANVRTAFKAGSKIPMSDFPKPFESGCSINPSLAGSRLIMRASPSGGQSI
jgi:hypothetical protein